MRRLLLVGLFIVALLSMLCIGFVMGALFSPGLGRVGQALEQRFNFSKGIPGIEPGPKSRIFQDKPQLTQQGVSIVEVVSGSPAAEAGLKPGEIIVSLNGNSIKQPSDMIGKIARLKPGDTVTLEVMQPGETKREITVKLGENPDKKGYAWLGVQIGPSIEIPNLPEGNNNEQLPVLPHNFGQEMMHPGALIREVLPGSPAEQAGLKTGQFIQAVDGVRLEGSKTLADIIAGHKPGDTITLAIINPGAQNNQAQEIQVKLGENPDKAGSAWLGIRYSSIDFNIDPETFPGG